MPINYYDVLKLTGPQTVWIISGCAVLLVTGLLAAVLIARLRRQRFDEVDLPAPSLRANLNFHAEGVCVKPCPIHAPSDHHMTDWPKEYRLFKDIFERTCLHGVGHPDPDSIAFVRAQRGEEDAWGVGIHGCDGCCRAAQVKGNPVATGSEPVA